MMMEKKQGDQALIGEALKLFLLLGIAKAMLTNHTYLMDLLEQSVNHLVTEIGLDPHNAITSTCDLFVQKPVEAIESGMPSIFPAGNESDGSWWSNLTAMPLLTLGTSVLWNTLMYVAVALLAGVVAWSGVAMGIACVIMTVISNVLLVLIGSLGVICIPFMLLPKFDKIFWSWIDGMTYALALKLTASGCMALVSAFYTANIPSIAVKNGNYIDIDWGAVLEIFTYGLLGYTLIKMSFTIAGIIAGTRLAISPDISTPKIGI